MWWKYLSTWWTKGGGRQPASVRPLLPHLNAMLEVGLSDEAILAKLFCELQSSPATLLPAATSELGWTAFLLWKNERIATAERLLFTCLAWYLRNSNDREMILTLTKDLQHIFEKAGRTLPESEIHQAARRADFRLT